MSAAGRQSWWPAYPAPAAVSLEIGCVRGTERFLEHDPPCASELDALRAHVQRLVSGAIAARPELGLAERLVGVAGTVAALVRLDRGSSYMTGTLSIMPS